MSFFSYHTFVPQIGWNDDDNGSGNDDAQHWLRNYVHMHFIVWYCSIHYFMHLCAIRFDIEPNVSLSILRPKFNVYANDLWGAEYHSKKTTCLIWIYFRCKRRQCLSLAQFVAFFEVIIICECVYLRRKTRWIWSLWLFFLHSHSDVDLWEHLVFFSLSIVPSICAFN